MKIVKVIQEYFELICMPNTNVFDIVGLVYIDNTSRADDNCTECQIVKNERKKSFQAKPESEPVTTIVSTGGRFNH